MSKDRVLLGVVAAPHGVRGLVRIKSYTEDPMAVAAYGPLSDETGKKAYWVEALSAARGAVLARIDLDPHLGRIAATGRPFAQAGSVLDHQRKAVDHPILRQVDLRQFVARLGRVPLEGGADHVEVRLGIAADHRVAGDRRRISRIHVGFRLATSPRPRRRMERASSSRELGPRDSRLDLCRAS